MKDASGLENHLTGLSEMPSIVDAIENVLGEDLRQSTGDQIARLSEGQQTALAVAIDQVVEAQTGAPDDPYGTVFLDDSSEVDLAYFNAEVPEVNDQTRKLLLYYPEVLVPWASIETGLPILGPEYLAYVVRYAATHKDLLRLHALTPVSMRILQDNSIDEVTFAAAQANGNVEFARYAKPYLPIRNDLPDENVVEDVQAFLFSLYKDVAYAGVLNVDPVLVDYSKQALLKYHLDAQLNAPISAVGREGLAGNVLASLDLPSLANLSLSDIVALRKNAEEYHEWRVALGRVLRRTADRIQHVGEIQRVFEDELDVMTEAAARIDEKISQSSLKKHLKATTERVSIGLGAAVASQQWQILLGQTTSLKGELLRAGPFVGLSVIWWFLFNRGQAPKELLLKFYHAVTDTSS